MTARNDHTSRDNAADGDTGNAWYAEERRYHEAVAADYAASHRDILFWQVPERLLLFSRLGSLAGRVVVDVGCGAATSPAKYIGERCDCLYIGFDISEELLRHAVHNMPDGIFVRTNAAHLPLRDQTADALLSLGFMHHLPDPYAFVGELARVHNGRDLVLLREPSVRAFRRGRGASPNEEGLDEERFLARCAQHGYTVESLTYLDSRFTNRLRRSLHQLGVRQIESSEMFMRAKVTFDRWLDRLLGRVLPYAFHGLDLFATLRRQAEDDPAIAPGPVRAAGGLQHALQRLVCPSCRSELALTPSTVDCTQCGRTYRREGNLLHLGDTD